jgi:hypothetical protein
MTFEFPDNSEEDPYLNQIPDETDTADEASPESVDVPAITPDAPDADTVVDTSDTAITAPATWDSDAQMEESPNEEPQASSDTSSHETERSLLTDFNPARFDEYPSEEDAPAALERHGATVKAALENHKEFVEEVEFGDTVIKRISLECTMPGGVALIRLSSNGNIRVNYRTFDGTETSQTYKTQANGVIRYDHDIEIQKATLAQPGDYPTSKSWELEYRDSVETQANQQLARQTGYGHRPISSEEQAYVYELVKQAELRKVPFTELDAIFRRRLDAEDPTTDQDSQLGAEEFGKYVHERIGTAEIAPGESLEKEVFGLKGEYVKVTATETIQDGKPAEPVVHVHADWDLDKTGLAKMFEKRPRLVAGVANAKIAIEHSYSVEQGKFVITRMATVTDMRGRVLHRNALKAVHGDRLEARKMRLFLANPSYARMYLGK